MEPKVSVIVPVYNAAEYLDTSIGSILGQTHSNLEVILVNDGSKDNSADICRKYAAADRRIIFIDDPENHGQSHARNRALEIMSGEFLIFVDSDDAIVGDAVERLLRCITERGVDVLGFNANYLTEAGCSAYIPDAFSPEPLSGEDYISRMLTVSGHIWDAVCLYFYRTEPVRRSGLRFVENRIFEDEIWVPEVLLAADRTSYMDFAAYDYYCRQHSTTTRTDINEKKYRDEVANFHELSEMSRRLEKQSSRDIFEDYLARMYMTSTGFIGFGRAANAKIEYDFIRRHVHRRSTALKYALFRFSRRLYFRLKERRAG